MILSRLRRRRDELGMSQKQIADQLGIADMTVSRWERGESAPQKRFWPKLEKITGIPMTEILFDPANELRTLSRQ